MLRPNFCRPDGRLVKLLLFSKLLDKSPRTFIYFTAFEKKRRVRSPYPTQPNFLVFGIIHLFKMIGHHHIDFNYILFSLEWYSIAELYRYLYYGGQSLLPSLIRQ